MIGYYLISGLLSIISKNLFPWSAPLIAQPSGCGQCGTSYSQAQSITTYLGNMLTMSCRFRENSPSRQQAPLNAHKGETDRQPPPFLTSLQKQIRKFSTSTLISTIYPNSCSISRTAFLPDIGSLKCLFLMGKSKKILCVNSIYDKLLTRGNYYNFIKTPNCVWKMAFQTITPLFESWKPPMERVLKGKGRNEFARLRALTQFNPKVFNPFGDCRNEFARLRALTHSSSFISFLPKK